MDRPPSIVPAPPDVSRRPEARSEWPAAPSPSPPPAPLPSLPSLPLPAESMAAAAGLDELLFQVPAGWTKSTVVTLHDPTNPAVALQLATEPMLPGDTFVLYANRVLVRAVRPGKTQVLDSDRRDLAGRAAVVTRSRIAQGNQTFEQFLIVVEPKPGPSRMVTVINAVAPESDVAQMHEALDELLMSVRFEGG